MIISSAKPCFDKYVRVGIKAMETVKNAIANPALDFLTELEKSITDTALYNNVLAAFPVALTKLGILTDCLDKPTPAEQITCFIKVVSNLPAIMQDSIYHKTAGLIANELAYQAGENPLPAHHIDTAVQIAYANDKASNPVSEAPIIAATPAPVVVEVPAPIETPPALPTNGPTISPAPIIPIAVETQTQDTTTTDKQNNLTTDAAGNPVTLNS